MFFSNTHWPQLTLSFYSILFETSIFQFNSPKCSSIIPDEVREHLTRDQRPFLHPESLQIFIKLLSFHNSRTSRITPDLQIHSFFSSVHLTHLLQGSGQRTPDTRSETIPSSRITPDLQIHSSFSSVHSLIFYRVQIREHLTRDQRPFLHPESLQIFRYTASPLQFTHLLQGSDQRTPDTRSETIPSSRITPDLQIHSFFSSVHLLIFYRVQIREHLTRDQRPFLHPESLQIFRFTASPLQFTHSSSTGFRSENTWHEIRDHSFIQNHSRSSDSQLLLFSSLTHLLQGSGQRTPDTRSETIPSSRITPDLQIHSFFSSVHLTHLLQGSDQRTPDTRSETIPSSRITPDLQIHSFFSSVHSLIFYRVQIREHLTRDQRPFLHPESLQIFRFTASSLQFTHSSSTGFRSENTWPEIRDHSFIQNHSRSSDTQLLLFSSLTHLLQGSGQRTPDTRSETIPSSRITPDLQIHSFSSSVHSLIFYRVQIREHLTRDQRPFLHPESLQIFRSTASPLQFTHSSSTGFRSENTWLEIRDHSFIQNHSRSSDSQLLLFSSPHSSSTGFRSENTWHEIRDHSFIQNHSRSSDSQLLLFSSPHSSSTGFRSENTWHEIRDHSFIQNHSRSSDSQLLLFSSLTHLLQGSGQRTPDTRSETIPSSRITPDLQIHSFFSSVHLTHLLQGSGQRTPDTRSETIPSSRITPDFQIHSFFSSVHSLIFYRVQIREHLTRDQRPFLHPESLQIFRFTASSLQFTHSSSTGFRSENTWHEIRDHSFIQNHSRSSDSQLLLFSSLTHLLQGSDQRTPDTRSETIPSSRITPDLQIHSFSSSVHLTHLLQGSGQRTPDTRSETIPSSRITPDLQIHSFFSSVHLTHLLQGSGQRTPDTRSETIPSSRITPDLQIHSFFSSVHSLIFYRVQIREHLTRDQRPFLHPESLQIFRFTASSLQFTHLLQGSGQRTPDTRSETIPSSRITPDLQIHSFSSSVHLTHVLQGSGQRTPDSRSETIPSSRITPDPSDSQLLLFTSLMFYRVQGRGLDTAEAWFCAQWPIFVLFLRFVFGLLYGWKIQTWPIIRFLTESVTYWFLICWYLI